MPSLNTRLPSLKRRVMLVVVLSSKLGKNRRVSMDLVIASSDPFRFATQAQSEFHQARQLTLLRLSR